MESIKSCSLSALEIEDPFLSAVEKKLAQQRWTHALFITLLVLEAFALLFFFPFFIRSALFAFMISLFLLTLFGFLLYRQYSLAEKEAHFESLVEGLVDEARKIHYKQGEPESHFAVSKMCSKLADKLYQREYRCLKTAKKNSLLFRTLSNASCWLYWRDILFIRELLLEACVEEHLRLVRAHPANLDAHTMLANAYVMLSGLYAPSEGEQEDRWTHPERYGKGAEEKFRNAAKKAVEEFKILKEYAPKDPWIYSQLAFSYKDLKMPEEEKAAYEELLELKPNDQETRFKLGALYFRLGENGKGLKIYDELRRAQHPRAEELLSGYGKAD